MLHTIGRKSSVRSNIKQVTLSTKHLASRFFSSQTKLHVPPPPFSYADCAMHTMGVIGFGIAIVENAYDFYDHFCLKTPVQLSNGVSGVANLPGNKSASFPSNSK